MNTVWLDLEWCSFVLANGIQKVKLVFGTDDEYSLAWSGMEKSWGDKLQILLLHELTLQSIHSEWCIQWLLPTLLTYQEYTTGEWLRKAQ